MKAFVSAGDVAGTERSGEHGGVGSIVFRRLLHADQFQSKIDFIDATVIPPHSTIGWHQHSGSEELYYIVDGSPIVRVQDDERRLQAGDVAVVHSGEFHELINDTNSNVAIFVVQVSL